jgi:hypothetical protein
MRFISLHVVGRELLYSQHIFNPNAFPSHVRSDVDACATKLSIIAYSLENIQREIQNDKLEFAHILNNDKAFIEFVPDPRKPVMALYYSVNFQVGLQSFFISIKSLLDIFTKIVSKLIEPKSTLRGFSKRKVDGVELTGGTLLRWLDQNAPNDYANKSSLMTVIRSNIDGWISDVVTKRDEIVHDGTLSNILEMSVPISKRSYLIKGDEIVLPTVLIEDHPKDLIKYCQEIWENVVRMIKDTLILLPNIDFSLINLSL